jgi:Domain of unknown function (DUF4145)
MALNWTCPHCDRPQLATTENTHSGSHKLYVGTLTGGTTGFRYKATACLNNDCKKLTFYFSLGYATFNNRDEVVSFNRQNDMLYSGSLYPRGAAKSFPDYIPQPLREDYEEACLILNDSPKAAATLIRRCLQGMIRDFAGITKATLDLEIKALKEALADGTADRAITAESVEAIDHVRKIGNIGAHMEKDINLIVPVDPGEASQLIALVEMLFEEWYVARNTRQQRLAQIGSLSAAKELARKAPVKALPPPDEPAVESE